MSLAALLRKRLLIVSGKGGVGKSTVCAAMALIAARHGQRVLTVEIDSKERISQLFGVPEVGHEGRQVYENIWAVNLRPAQVMDDFVATQVPLRRVLDQVLQSPMYKYFVAAAPGLKELVTLGKIMVQEEARRSRRSKKPEWDLIIIDAPATGHGIAFLRVPYLVCDTLKMGPVHKQAKKIIGLLTDKRRTAFLLVTLAEEMPVNEAIEMYHTLEDELDISLAQLIINGVYPQVLSARERTVFERLDTRLAAADPALADGAFVRAMVDCLDTAARRRTLNDKYIAKLSREIPHPAIEVPFVFASSLDFDLVETVAASLEERLAAVAK